jgi:hypothetical protein
MICFVNHISRLNKNNETLLQILRKHYFCFVHVSLHSIYRKIIASLLLALLVFIYAEKVFHTHIKAANNTEQSGISITSNNAGCVICDFTVAKDAELPESFGTAIPYTFLVKEYTSASIAYHFQTGNTSSDRGPPSF